MADSPSVIGVGWAGTILSILLYASQLPLMRRLIREGDATLPGYSFLPVLGQIAQAGPWCGYAICVQPTIALLVANFAGVGFASLYLLIFAIFTPTWLGRLRIAASGIAVGGVIVAFYVRCCPEGERERPGAPLPFPEYRGRAGPPLQPLDWP